MPDAPSLWDEAEEWEALHRPTAALLPQRHRRTTEEEGVASGFQRNSSNSGEPTKPRGTSTRSQGETTHPYPFQPLRGWMGSFVFSLEHACHSISQSCAAAEALWGKDLYHPTAPKPPHGSPGIWPRRCSEPQSRSPTESQVREMGRRDGTSQKNYKLSLHNQPPPV